MTGKSTATNTYISGLATKVKITMYKVVSSSISPSQLQMNPDFENAAGKMKGQQSPFADVSAVASQLTKYKIYVMDYAVRNSQYCTQVLKKDPDC